MIICSTYQAIEGVCQARYRTQVRLFQGPTAGSGCSQHLPHPVTLLLFALPGFGHLLSEVLAIEYEAIEQKLRCDVGATVLALISPDSQHRDTATGRTPLKGHGRVELPAAGNASALALRDYLQRTVACQAAMADQLSETTASRYLLLHPVS